MLLNKLIYLAAPYSHSDPAEIENRMAQFRLIDQQFTREGKLTVSPLYKHWIINDTDIPNDWNYWGEYSDTLLSGCDTMFVIMFDGWKDSVGIRKELELSAYYGIEVHFFDPVASQFDRVMSIQFDSMTANPDLKSTESAQQFIDYYKK